MQAKQQKFSIGYSIALVLALLLIQAVFFRPHAENLSYSEFKPLAKKGKEVVDRAALTQLIADAESLPRVGGDRGGGAFSSGAHR